MGELLVLGMIAYFIWYHTQQRGAAKKQEDIDKAVRAWEQERRQAKRKAKWEEMMSEAEQQRRQ